MTDLADRLAAAGVATHLVTVSEAAGRLERDVLDALLAAFGGTVFRVGAFAYALDARGPDGAAADGGADPAAAVRAGIEGLLGAGTVQVATLPQPDAPPAEPTEARALLLLEAMAGAAGRAVRAEAPGCRAVIDAEFALAAARLTADGLDAITRGDGGELEGRLARIEGALAEIAERTGYLAERPETDPGAALLLERLGAIEATCLEVAERLAALPDPADAMARTAALFAPLAERLESLEVRLGGLAAPGAATPDQVASFNRFSVALQGILRRFDAQVSAVEQAVGRLGGVAVPAPADGGEAGAAALRGELERLAGDVAAAERRTGLALAELVARLEMSGAIAAAPSPAAGSRAVLTAMPCNNRNGIPEYTDR